MQLRFLLSSANHHCRHPFSAAPIFFSKNLSFSNSFPILFKTQFNKQKSPFQFANFSVYSKKHNGTNDNRNSRSFNRNRSALRETVVKKDKQNSDRGGLLAMEEKDGSAKVGTEGLGFNRKRAEGRDESSKKNLQLKVRKLNPANTTSYVQIIGTGMDTHDTSPSVLLFFDKQRIIFNAGEGLQRFCNEHKIKLSKIDHIFLSRVCSETAGGLPGLLLTLAGMGDEGMSVNVWGPSDLKYLVDAMKSFIPNAAMVHTRSFGPTPDSNGSPRSTPDRLDDPFVLIDDEVVKISAILLRPNHAEVSECGLNASKPGDLSVIYICELPEIKGKFDPQKAIALGLRPGPKFRELQLGNSVQSDHQDIMVHPSDVLGPSVPGPIVLLVDCPTSSHFRALSGLQCLAPYYTDMTNMDCDESEGSKNVNCVIHLTPAKITQTDDYGNWMSKFGAAQHIMAGHEMNNIEVPILKASARLAARLNYICPQFFPSPGFWSLQNSSLPAAESRSLEKNLLSETTKLIPAENLLKFQLRPYANLGLEKSSIPSLSSPSDIIKELLSEIPEVGDASQKVTQLWVGNGDTSIDKEANEVITEEPWLPENVLPSCLEDITREDAEIVLLGTGSSQPSKYRNVSSILINLFSKGSILLDCGEGTLGQLKRRFGVQGADEAVKGLKCIWISHIHADHHTGLARILALRRDLLEGLPHEPIIVVGPGQLKRYLDAYQRLEDLDMQFLNCFHTTEASLEAFESNEDNGNTVGENTESALFSRGSRMQSQWKRPASPTQIAAAFPIFKSLKKALESAGVESLMSFPVVHCPQAFGIALQAADRVNKSGKTIPGWKIVYSGDTRPCPELVRASQGATVLIHEATFEDSLVDEAIARNHSTTREAVEVGDSAGAYRIILTHFSQRYPKIPVFDEIHMHKTCIAFDMMSVNLADIHVLPRVLPYLKLLFRDELLVDESEDANLASAVA